MKAKIIFIVRFDTVVRKSVFQDIDELITKEWSVLDFSTMTGVGFPINKNNIMPLFFYE